MYCIKCDDDNVLNLRLNVFLNALCVVYNSNITKQNKLLSVEILTEQIFHHYFLNEEPIRANRNIPFKINWINKLLTILLFLKQLKIRNLRNVQL